MENDIHLNYQNAECGEFTQDGRKQKISIVIAPLKVSETDGMIKLRSGCNFWKACQNKNCEFSLISYGGIRK